MSKLKHVGILILPQERVCRVGKQIAIVVGASSVRGVMRAGHGALAVYPGSVDPAKFWRAPGRADPGTASRICSAGALSLRKELPGFRYLTRRDWAVSRNCLARLAASCWPIHWSRGWPVI